MPLPYAISDVFSTKSSLRTLCPRSVTVLAAETESYALGGYRLSSVYADTQSAHTVSIVALHADRTYLPAEQIAQDRHTPTDVDASAVEYCPAPQRVAQVVGKPEEEE